MIKPVSDLLSALGETPEEVARTLESKGIRGYRKTPHCCPIARYLQAEGWEASAYVSGVYTKPKGSQEDMKSTNNPVPVTLFIQQFDDGKFQSLWPVL